MNKRERLREAMLLYAVTDRMWLKESPGRSLADVVAEAIAGGITFLQIREKNLSYDEFLQQAKELKWVAAAHQIPYVVNDEVAIAKAVDADGVHIGQSDTKLQQARAILGPDKIIGVSVQTVAQAVQAEQQGADYLGVGALYSTATKPEAAALDHEEVRNICQAVTIPVVGIGGIHKGNIASLKGLGLDGIAAVSAIFASQQVQKDTRELYQLCKETFYDQTGSI